MGRSLNVSLPNELRDFVDAQAGEVGLYATPTEYLRALIRADMEAQGVVAHVMSGINDLRHGRLSDKSILDILDET